MRKTFVRVVAATVMVAAGLPIVLPTAADAVVVICERKNKMKLRRNACVGKETQVDAAELGDAGPKGDKGDTGDQGVPGPGARWALVDESFNIVAQSGGISVALSPGSSILVLDFGSSMAGKTIAATPAFSPTDTGNKGPIEVALCGPNPQGISPVCGTLFGPSFEDSRYVVLVTTSTTGTNEAHPFYIAVF